MQDSIGTALLIIWVLNALALVAGGTGRAVWTMTATAAAFFAYGGYLLLAAANGGGDL